MPKVHKELSEPAGQHMRFKPDLKAEKVRLRSGLEDEGDWPL
jgi:hypothetical protein